MFNEKSQDFNGYRELIKREEDKFEQEIDTIFKIVEK